MVSKLKGNPSIFKGLDVKKLNNKNKKKKLRIRGVKKKEGKEERDTYNNYRPIPGSVSMMIFFGSAAMEVPGTGEVSAPMIYLTC